MARGSRSELDPARELVPAVELVHLRALHNRVRALHPGPARPVGADYGGAGQPHRGGGDGDRGDRDAAGPERGQLGFDRDRDRAGHGGGHPGGAQRADDGDAADGGAVQRRGRRRGVPDRVGRVPPLRLDVRFAHGRARPRNRTLDRRGKHHRPPDAAHDGRRTADVRGDLQRVRGDRGLGLVLGLEHRVRQAPGNPSGAPGHAGACAAGGELAAARACARGGRGADRGHALGSAVRRHACRGGFGGGGVVAGAEGAGEHAGTVKSTSAADAAIQLAYASRVVVVPGYGMAVAQAQHAVREMAKELEKRGVEVQYAIHPVAGRMPGHMNVLLAEADVPYDQLEEMEQANAEFPRTDVSLVIGANDVTNPAAKNTPSSPIYGMPILEVNDSRSVIVIKRSMNPGFAGIENELYYDPKTSMLFGDAKAAVGEITAELAQL